MPVGSGAKVYTVPCITLLCRAKGKIELNCRMGRHTVLDGSCEYVFGDMGTSLKES
jgi:hypothetical protein